LSSWSYLQNSLPIALQAPKGTLSPASVDSLLPLTIQVPRVLERKGRVWQWAGWAGAPQGSGCFHLGSYRPAYTGHRYDRSVKGGSLARQLKQRALNQPPGFKSANHSSCAISWTSKELLCASVCSSVEWGYGTNSLSPRGNSMS
jgi:hypothetical protein